MKKKKEFTLKPDEVCQIFDKFSHPLTKSAKTETQKSKSLEIAKTFWLFLITGTDSETNIYNVLVRITSNNHESNIELGALYFHKMKKALMSTELLKIQNHYKSINNFNQLEEWGISPQALKEFH